MWLSPAAAPHLPGRHARVSSRLANGSVSGVTVGGRRVSDIAMEASQGPPPHMQPSARAMPVQLLCGVRCLSPPALGKCRPWFSARRKVRYNIIPLRSGHVMSVVGACLVRVPTTNPAANPNVDIRIIITVIADCAYSGPCSSTEMGQGSWSFMRFLIVIASL